MKSSTEQMNLVGRYLSGEISREEMEQLESDMLADEQLRKDFLAYARVDASLPGIVSGSGSLLEFTQNRKAKRSFLRWGLTVAAAILMLCLYLIAPIDSSTNGAISPGTTNHNPIAVVIDHVDDTIAPKKEIWGQETFEFQTGGIHLRFNEAVDFIFEGPGSFDILGPKLVKVHQGKTRTIVFNESGHEFSIITPEAKYVDLGTEFCLEISKNQKDKLDVQVGEIEIFDLKTNQSLAKIQQSNNLANASSSNWKENFFNSDSVISQPGDMGFQRWKKRMSHYASQDDVLACFDFTVRTPESLSRATRQHVPREWRSSTGDMKNNRFLISNPERQEVTHGIMHYCLWGVGRWSNKQSLLFHHPKSHVSLELKENQEQLSLNTWFKANQLANPLNAILSTRHWNKSGLFRIEFERSGKLQTNFWGEPYRSTLYNKLNPGWQMLSLVIQLDGSGYHSTTFLDGVSAETRKLNHFPLVRKTGLHLGNAYSKKSKKFFRNFGGSIDELVLWYRALSSTEIAQLYEQGTPKNRAKLFSQTSP